MLIAGGEIIQENLDKTPLLVDIDRCLMRTEMARESFWAAMGRDFSATMRQVSAPVAVRQAAFARIANLAIDLLPLDPEITAQVNQARADGRDVTLFAAADQSLVDALAERLNLSGTHFGLQPGTRDTRTAVETAMQSATTAPFNLISGPLTGPALRAAAARDTNTSRPQSPRSLIKELRPHQWVKNGLLLLPLIAAQTLFSPALLPVLLSVVAFCAGASAIYIVNDLLDLEADRLHPTKRNRPIASGALPTGTAYRTSIIAATIAVLLAAAAGPLVAVVVVVYMLTSLVYSLRLKRLRWVDLGTLVGLYCLRMVAGAVAAGVAVSPWLWAFVAATFLILAVVKRLTALVRTPHHAQLPGRGYSRQHIRPLFILGMVGIALSVTTFLAYFHSPEATILYTRPWALRLASLPAALWLVRMLRLSLTGKEDFDPLVFVARDKTGLLIIASAACLYLLAL